MTTVALGDLTIVRNATAHSMAGPRRRAESRALSSGFPLTAAPPHHTA